MNGFDGNSPASAATADKVINWGQIVQFLHELGAHRRLLFVIVAAFLLIGVALYARSAPSYKATAVIGPPGPSPSDTFMSSVGGSAGSTLGAARRLLGGASTQSSTDPFQEYMQLLQSVRLARVLIDKDHILQTIFENSWDAKNKKWLPPSALSRTVGGVKRLITNRPQKTAPDVDSLLAFFQKNLDVASASNGITTKFSPLLGGSSYVTVSLTLDDPKKAERVLSLILLEADNLIRQDLHKDISARLVFLNAEASKVMVSDQREALIGVLSGQEQLQMMIEADHRFASTLIDPPYASDQPTSKGLFYYCVMAIILSFMTWVALVYLSARSCAVCAFVARLERATYVVRLIRHGRTETRLEPEA